ncbi:MAG: sensor histidine kinase [Methanobacterium sp.]
MIFSRDKMNITFIRNILIFLTIFLGFLAVFTNYSPYFPVLNDITFLLINFMVLSILIYVTKQSSIHGRNAFIGWTLITLSIIVTIIGNIIWIILPAGFNQVSFPSVADIFYLAYYPLILIGILHLPVKKNNEIRNYQVLLDTGILIISAALILWIIIIDPILQNNSVNSAGMGIYVSYLLLDIFLLFTLIYLFFNWFGKVKKVPLAILTISALILVLTNIIFVYQFLFGEYKSGGLLDAGWLISYILTALAGISYINDDKFKLLRFKSLKFPIKIDWSLYLPMIWLFFIYLFLIGIYMYPDTSNLNVIIWGSLIIITMVFIRQILSLNEINRNKRLLEENKEILEKRETHLRLITDNMMDMVTRCDFRGIYQYVSPSSSKLLGYEPYELLGKNALDFVHPDDVQSLKESFIKAEDNKDANEIEYRYKKASGRYIWIQTVGKPIFNQEDVYQGFICSSRNVDDRKNAEEQIKTSLEEKKVLLQEIHHRVKNNMQIVSSLLSLQSRYIEDEKALDVFKESQNRVMSMAMIHESLYQDQNLARINFDEYIRKLVSGLFNSYNVNSGLIMPQMDLCKVSLDIDTAVPCGLILNELVTNSLKHAFPVTDGRGPTDESFISPTAYSSERENEKFSDSTADGHDSKEGIINIILSRESEEVLKLIISDNGVGFPENVDFQNTSSLGLQLVNTLINQINGTIELRNGNETEFIIKFKNNN